MLLYRDFPLIYLFVLTVGLAAGIFGGIVGTGTSIMLLPVLAYAFGPKQAVPIMAIAAILANAARIMAWWREVDWRAVAAYAIPGVPAAALGARTLLALPSRRVDIAIGVFPDRDDPAAALVRGAQRHAAAVVARDRRRGRRLPHRHRRLDRADHGADLHVLRPHQGCAARHRGRGSLAVYISKALTFRRFDALPLDIILKGLIAGSSLFAGAFIAKRVVLRFDADTFRLMMEGLMLLAGLSMLWGAAVAG